MNLPILTALVLCASAHAQDAAPPAAAPSCRGLGADGSYAKNVAKHRQAYDAVCGAGGATSKAIQTAQAKLKSCTQISSLIWRNGRAMDNHGYGDKMVERQRSACEAYKEYTNASSKICQETDAAAGKEKELERSIDRIDDSNQTAGLQAAARNLGELSTLWKGLADQAKASGDNLEKTAAGVNPAASQPDVPMHSIIGNLKSVVNGFTTYVNDQANRRLAQREAHASDQNGEENLGAIRFRTTADYHAFNRMLSDCKLANAELDRVDAAHHRDLGAELGAMKKEAPTAEAYFRRSSETARVQALANQERAAHLATAGNPLAKAGTPDAEANQRVLPAGQTRPVEGPTAAQYSAEQQEEFKNAWNKIPTAARGRYLASQAEVGRFTDSSGTWIVYQSGQGSMQRTWAQRAPGR